jgi:hypothetical protein
MRIFTSYSHLFIDFLESLYIFFDKIIWKYKNLFVPLWHIYIGH